MRVNHVVATVVLLGVLAALAFGQAPNESRVLVLKDGRSVAIRGDYEVYGNEVQFTHSNGEYMTLSLEKVDLDATDRRNEALARGEVPEENRGDHVVERQAPVGGGRYTNIGQPKKEEEAEPEPTQVMDGVFENPQLQELWRQLELEGDPDDFWRLMNEQFGPQKLLLYLGTLLFSMLLAFGAQIYLIVKGFQEGILWGLVLLFLTLCPLPLISLVVMMIFIVGYCHPHRLTLTVLLFSPVVVALAGGIFMAIA